MKVKDPFVYSETVKPIALPSPGEKVASGTKAVVSGFGITQVTKVIILIRHNIFIYHS